VAVQAEPLVEPLVEPLARELVLLRELQLAALPLRQ
jgi:hypothetical protein